MNRRALLALAAACWLLLPSTVWSEEIVRRISWPEVAAAKALKAGTVVSDPEGARLRLVHEGSAPATLPLLTIERPGIRSARYAVRGRVRYERVADGYLEMWNHVPAGSYFSRSLADSGPLRRLQGSSGWRAFVLPFFNRDGAPPPDRLVLNLVLAGPGTVEIGSLELVQFAPGEDPLASSTGEPGAWWSGRQAGALGAIGGTALGTLGALVGWLGSAGRARGFVLGTLKGLAWLGLGALVLGLAAVLQGQPYQVYYPLVLLGGIGGATGFVLPRSLSKRYEELELRRMQALDA